MSEQNVYPDAPDFLPPFLGGPIGLYERSKTSLPLALEKRTDLEIVREACRRYSFGKRYQPKWKPRLIRPAENILIPREADHTFWIAISNIPPGTVYEVYNFMLDIGPVADRRFYPDDKICLRYISPLHSNIVLSYNGRPIYIGGQEVRVRIERVARLDIVKLDEGSTIGDGSHSEAREQIFRIKVGKVPMRYSLEELYEQRPLLRLLLWIGAKIAQLWSLWTGENQDDHQNEDQDEIDYNESRH